MVTSSGRSGTSVTWSGPDAARNRDHLGRGRHLDVEPRGNHLAQQLDVTVLDVPPIAAQVDGDALGARQLRDDRRRHGLGLAGLAGLANGRDMVDVDAQSHSNPLVVLSPGV